MSLMTAYLSVFKCLTTFACNKAHRSTVVHVQIWMHALVILWLASKQAKNWTVHLRLARQRPRLTLDSHSIFLRNALNFCWNVSWEYSIFTMTSYRQELILVYIWMYGPSASHRVSTQSSFDICGDFPRRDGISSCTLTDSACLEEKKLEKSCLKTDISLGIYFKQKQNDLCVEEVDFLVVGFRN